MEKFIDEIISHGIENDLLTMQSRYNFEIESEYKSYIKAWIFLKRKNIITKVKTGQYQLSETALDINNAGGWKKYNIKQERLKLRNERKEEYDFQVSRFQAKSKYFPYIISALSFIIACFAYFKPINKSNIQQLSKDEIIHIIDSISTSNQTKMVDSLHNSKNLVDTIKK
ncbi:hypothetical protein [Aureibaculum conchae]|uniref:hypothetical protein n=1 Tax=Aureibaculum sp. 2308TA14-22 TaxID=3108392 RepID=UPI00339832DF